jgi:hypothetical protein
VGIGASLPANGAKRPKVCQLYFTAQLERIYQLRQMAQSHKKLDRMVRAAPWAHLALASRRHRCHAFRYVCDGIAGHRGNWHGRYRMTEIWYDPVAKGKAVRDTGVVLAAE